MNKTVKKITALLMGGMLALTGCTAGKKEAEVSGEKNDYDKTVIATVNGQDITLADFNFAYYTSASQYQQYAMYMGVEDWENQEIQDGKTAGQIVRENAVEEMKQLIVVQQKAKEYDVVADADTVKKVKEDKQNVIDNNFGGEEQYQEYLKQLFTSDYAIEKYLQRASILTNLFNLMCEKGKECYIDPAEIEYSDDQYIKASHVLISTQSEDVSDEDALKKANEVITKLNAGEDMAKLIEEYGEDPGMQQQDYYVFGEGEMVDEFYQAAKALEVGAYTKEPVKSSYGYHIIMRYALDQNDDKFQELMTSAQQEKFMEKVNAWTETASVTVNDDAIDAALDSQRKELVKMQEEALKAAQKESEDEEEPKSVGDGDAEDAE